MVTTKQWGIRWALGAALVLTTACAGDDTEAADDDADASEFRELPPPDLPPAVVSQICPSYRQAVRRDDGSCASFGAWTGSKMFGAGATGEFAKYCVYQHSGTPDHNAVTTFQAHAGITEAATECLSVRPQTEILTTTYPPLHALSIDRFDQVDGVELDIGATAAGRSPVTVAVVDTTPLLDPATPRNPHGIIVADLIQDISHGCETSSLFCKVLVQNVLGMPRYGFGKGQVDGVHGGYAAFPSEAAAGVYSAIASWEANPSPRPKLIINLSLAWLRKFGGDDLLNAPPGVDAFYLALQRASCRGALIVAAAGNAKDDCESGPMLPADWEKLPAPTAAQCLAAGVASPVTSIAAYQPLVHSIGGVDTEDEPIPETRELGRPRLAALASNVVGSDPTTPPLTGTSMSAAAFSGIAALVWSYNPWLTSHEIAELAWSSGIATGDTADYGANGTLGAISRLTACSTLAAACDDPRASCPGSFALDCGGTPPPADDLANAIAGVVADATEEIEVAHLGECASYCSGTTDNWYAADGSDECPLLDGPSRTDYLTSPQPDNLGCSSCTWYTTSSNTANQTTTILAGLTAKYVGMNVTNAVVNLTLTGQSRPTPYDLGDVDLVYGTTSAVTIKNGPTVPIVGGTITLTFAGSPALKTTDDLVTGAAM
jgi:Subtilase family